LGRCLSFIGCIIAGRSEDWKVDTWWIGKSVDWQSGRLVGWEVVGVVWGY
jgi:hypothetical protein